MSYRAVSKANSQANAFFGLKRQPLQPPHPPTHPATSQQHILDDSRCHSHAKDGAHGSDEVQSPSRNCLSYSKSVSRAILFQGLLTSVLKQRHKTKQHTRVCQAESEVCWH